MQVLSTTKARRLNKKRNQSGNLFGLGVTSLIAACGADGADSTDVLDAEGGPGGPGGPGGQGGPGGPVDEGGPGEDLPIMPSTLPFEELKAPNFASAFGGVTQESKVAIYTTPAGIQRELYFADAEYDEYRIHGRSGTGLNIHPLTNVPDQYDVVVTVKDLTVTGNEVEGSIFIYWDAESATRPKADGSGDRNSTHLEVEGIAMYRYISSDVSNLISEFFQIAGADKDDEPQYDMVINSFYADKSDTIANAGAIYILWDIADYSGGTKTIDLNNLDGDVASGSLTIYGAEADDKIGSIHVERNGIIGSANSKFVQLGGKYTAKDDGKYPEEKYDMVIRSGFVDNNKGAFYVLWDVADYYTASHNTIDLADTKSTKHGLLTIKGAAVNDHIGNDSPDFLKLSGTADQYDMVIRSKFVGGNKGVIYILWDIDSYYDEANLHKTVVLDPSIGVSDIGFAAHGLLAIYGTSAGDHIGTHAPAFLQLGGGTGDDMVIRSERVEGRKGAIYIVWDVDGYYDAKSPRVVNLNSSTDVLLKVYSSATSNYIGTHAPEFLQLGGKADNHDMVIASWHSNKPNSSGKQGAVYILWDVADYAGAYTGIDLNRRDDNGNSAINADSGSLAIYGAKPNDEIGTSVPKFLQIGGKGDNHDMVIGARTVDKGSSDTNEGAIYILWDVADYYGTQDNTVIDLAAADSNAGNYATSGLLTIYGGSDSAQLGIGSLYSVDNTTLTNIDGDTANGGTKDIAFRDNNYTYILFGDKVAEVVDGKVTSKTIDLALIDNIASFTAGFFTVTFDGAGIGTAASTSGNTKEDDSVGYRFNGIKDNFAAIERDFPKPPSSGPLSDADADLGVWDIA